MVKDFDSASSDSEGDALSLCVPPNPRYAKSVRDEILSYAGRFGVSRPEIEEFMFAVGEALANAIEHSGTGGSIDVRCQISEGKIVATIVDSGRGFNSAEQPQSPPPVFAERGRGLSIMRNCAEIFTLHSVPGQGTSVVLGHYIDHRSGARA
jgi:anti-sigma regulatory factor (Ser/Thr protein kinase)